MKKYFFAWLWLGLQFTSSPVVADHHFKIVPLIPAAVYAPAGFDDNDNAQVVIEGIFPDSCHSNGPLELKIDKDRKEIRIQNGSIVAEGKCQMMLGPYTRIVDLGPIPVGQYKLVFIDPTNHLIEKGTLSINRAATPSSDEFFYAPVKNVHVDFIDEQSKLTVSGVFTNSCLNMKVVKVLYHNPEVLEVLPIAQFQGADCKPEQRPFSVTVKLRDNLQGKKLVHIRSMNGQALNQLYSF